jgi:hypothetical protein
MCEAELSVTCVDTVWSGRVDSAGNIAQRRMKTGATVIEIVVGRGDVTCSRNEDILGYDAV